MQLKTLFACASLVAATVAQTTQRIAFTVLPTNVQAGKPVTLQWGGGDNSPVTITLQQGTTTDLKTVSVLTGDATGKSYIWTPSASLPDGDNYALKIEQGDQEPNYTGMITLTGGSSSSSSPFSSSTSVSVSASSTVFVATTTPASLPSVGIPPSSQNATAIASPIVTANGTTTPAPIGTGAVGTGVGASGSAATGTSLHRNTTLSKATLTSSAAASSSAAATTSSGSSSSSGASAPSASGKSGAAVAAASNFALLCAAVVGVIYLG